MTPTQMGTEIHRLNNQLQTMTTQQDLWENRFNRASFDAAQALKDRDSHYNRILQLEAALKVAGRAVSDLQQALLQEQAKAEGATEAEFDRITERIFRDPHIGICSLVGSERPELSKEKVYWLLAAEPVEEDEDAS